MSQTVITLENIHKSFGDVKAVNGVSFSVPESICFGLLGPNGAGKTTLLKMLLGFYHPVAGEILIGDLRLSNLSLRVWREKVGAVMQDGFLFPNTIASNISPGSEEIDEERLI